MTLSRIGRLPVLLLFLLAPETGARWNFTVEETVSLVTARVPEAQVRRVFRGRDGPGSELNAPVDLSPALCEMLRACSHRDVLEEGTGDWYVAVGEACLVDEGQRGTREEQLGGASAMVGGRAVTGGGAEAGRGRGIPRIAEQEPVLLRIPGPATITRFGAVIVNAALASGGATSRVALDPDEHGACDKLRAPEDLSWRGPPHESDPGVDEVLVLSQPWGHTAFHFIAECLPKLILALPELQANEAMLVHVPLSTDLRYCAERAMTEEYLSVFGIPPERLVSGEILARGAAWIVSPTRCAIAQAPLIRHLRTFLRPALLHPSAQEGIQEALEASDAALSLPPSEGGAREQPIVLLVVRGGLTRRLCEQDTARIRQGVARAGGVLVKYDASAGLAPNAVLHLFARAGGIVAPHGAGLANLVAARAGAHVLEFHPSDPTRASSGLFGINLCNMHIAQTLGLRYTGALMHPRAAGEGEVGEEWCVDDGVVERWVELLAAGWRDEVMRGHQRGADG